ncbi:hydantoinase B/oxoprolinase family protein [Caldilinea sp.]|jgi:N-methylhydantoinase B|uniref:hydantoinase B/oxoprolinase family protein n=1 Tax=Caldilinea sp. TaxID=2293560 RepID=UPI001B1A7D38|nr:hydantoinase B/oxoprolinase family protein [Caldilinea sp.]MBO9394760.1 hydantoinase B/oxoprolinase family protein [Caldilinea sp.]
MDPITLQLYHHRFAGVAEEMGVTLRRTAYSPNIKERLDFSCALFDGQGNLVAQAAHIPAHLGAMPASVRTILHRFPNWEDGDVVIVNDPFEGGNHLPDITMIAPVFVDGQRQPQGPAFFVASRAHHADVGGMTPGSLPLSTEIFQEGLIIPPLKLYRGGVLNEDVLRLILRNVRTPDERRGDLAAQRAAAAVGIRRLRELAAQHGLEEVLAYAGHLQRYSERITRAAIAQWSDGVYPFEDVIELIEDDRLALTPIRVTATIAGDEIVFDFTGTASVVHGSLNAVIAITQSACYYAIRCLLDEELPMNAGCFAPVHVRAPDNTLVNAGPPAAVAAGNVETSQRITDVVLGALAQALPDRIPAASQGTMNNLTIGGLREDGTPFTYYETIGGGMGGGPSGDGLSGVQVHMTNTLNTPVEALEIAYPFRVRRYSLRTGSGGDGLHRGGDGIVREYEFLAPVTVTLISERRAVAPWGLAGGRPGAPGRNLLISRNGEEAELPSKFTRRFQPGERLRIETPGGGGWGSRKDKID